MEDLKERLIFGSSSSSSQLQDSTISIQNLDDERSDIYQQRSNLDAESQRTSLTNPNLHRSKSAPAMPNIAEIDNFVEVNPPQFGKPSIVRKFVMMLIMYLSVGVVIYLFNRDNFRGTKTHPVVNAIYYCIMTMCTIGYADITPNSIATKLFSIIFVLVWFGFLDILLSRMLDVKKGRVRIHMKVAFALVVVVVCVGIGVTFMHFVERVDWFDSFYLSVMAVTTVGFGDRVFSSLPGRVFASIWLLVSTLAFARAFLYLVEATVDKRERMMVKWVLSQDMSAAQFHAADIDNNGFVSKSEYTIFKLKEMGKVSENDILQICKQFERLDSSNCGKITLTDLMKSHH